MATVASSQCRGATRAGRRQSSTGNATLDLHTIEDPGRKARPQSILWLNWNYVQDYLAVGGIPASQDDAIRETKRAMASVHARRSAAYGADFVILAADTYVIVGDYEAALKTLEAGWAVSGVPEQYSWKLTSDPLYAPLKNNPRFQKLAAFRPPATMAPKDSSGS